MSDQVANFILAVTAIPIVLICGLVVFCGLIAMIDAINTYCGGRNIERVLDRFRRNRG